MITMAFCQTMARYNGFKNSNVISEANAMIDAGRSQDRGAFFGSIAATFNHLLWGDTDLFIMSEDA